MPWKFPATLLNWRYPGHFFGGVLFGLGERVASLRPVQSNPSMCLVVTLAARKAAVVQLNFVEQLDELVAKKSMFLTLYSPLTEYRLTRMPTHASPITGHNTVLPVLPKLEKKTCTEPQQDPSRVVFRTKAGSTMSRPFRLPCYHFVHCSASAFRVRSEHRSRDGLFFSKRAPLPHQ